jgi:hypothetical protein
MGIISEQVVGLTGGVLSWFLRITGITRVLRGRILFALLDHPL